MKLPKIKNNKSVKEQLDKVNEEILELNAEFYIFLNYDKTDINGILLLKKSFTYELLDSLTALLNLYEKAKKNGLIINDGWIEKMKRYETEKGYVIEGWVCVDE